MRENRRTQIQLPGDAEARRSFSHFVLKLRGQALLAEAEAAARAVLAGHEDEPVFVAVAFTDLEQPSRTLHAEVFGPRTRDFLQVGRHSSTSFVLDHDDTIPLRQMLLVPRMNAAGQRRVQALGLTREPTLTMENGEVCGSLDLVGRGMFLLGPVPFVVFDSEWLKAPKEPEPEPVRAPEPAAPGAVPPEAAAGSPEAEPPPAEPPRRDSVVPLSKRSVTTLACAVPVVPSSESVVRPTPEDGPTIRLRFVGERGTITVDVPTSKLATGIVLGRDDEKCFDPRLGHVLGEPGISRAHCLIRGDEHVLEVFDIGSTNGLFGLSGRMRYWAGRPERLIFSMSAGDSRVFVSTVSVPED